MSVSWLLLITLGVVARCHRIPRQSSYGTDLPGQSSYGTDLPGQSSYGTDLPHNSRGGNEHYRHVPLAHAPHTSVAVCKLRSSAGHNVLGDIVLRQTNPEDPVEITGIIEHLTPGFHGFHVHQNADLSNNCKAAGPHFNPEKNFHGAPHDVIRHAGDLGNIFADERGFSEFKIFDRQITLFENHPRQVLGRAIVVHQKEDDFGRGSNEESKKTGNAGARVACCVIESARVHHKYHMYHK